jgi:hypothetical protein
VNEINSLFKGQVAKLFQPAGDPAPGPRMQGPDPAAAAAAAAAAEEAEMKAEMPDEMGEVS